MRGTEYSSRPLSAFAAIAIGLLAATAACGRGASKDAAADSGSAALRATPVTMATVTSRTMDVTVSGPGEVDTFEDERVRAPFSGVLTSLEVKVGDRVRAGQTIGSMVSENADAAVRGARSMVATARSDADRSAAAEALRLAEANMVVTPIKPAKSGVVISRPASAGERLAQGDSIVSVGVAGRMLFYADIAQSALASVHAGQPARVALTSRAGVISGTVHTIMPADTGSTATMRVQIDLAAQASAVVGLFGTATIVVAEHANSPVVPKTALLRDDITGETKVSLVGADDIAYWVTVTPGIVDSAWAELASPRLTVGQRVITSGQAGLPDSTRVVAAPDSGRRAGEAQHVAGAPGPPPKIAPSRTPVGRGGATPAPTAKPPL